MTESIWRPSDRRLRQFAVLWTLFSLCVAIRTCWPTLRVLPAAAFSLASILGMIGCFRPHIIRPVYVSWIIAVFPIGWTISHFLLGVLFFGLFTPLGLLFRLCGRDALCLKLRSETASYWTQKEASTSKHRYLQQF
jgi:hypothetical protein